MRLKELRENRNLTQLEVATAIGGTQSNYAKWEKNIVQPSAEFVSKLADFFEVSTDYLLGRSDDFGNVTIQGAAPQLTADERELLDCYHSLSTKYRAVALDTMRGLSGRTESNTTKKKA